MLLFCALALGCQTPAPTESTVDQCSNGRDDDGDGFVDCNDPACRVYAFCLNIDGGTDAGPMDAGPRPDGALCTRPLDVVLSLDVSSSMTGILQDLAIDADALWSVAHTLDPEARISMIVFVDDALAIGECAPFTDAAALRGELERWRTLSSMNTSPGGVVNQDCPENSLDALHLVTTACTFRPGAARVVLHLTDDTFAENPAVLSGPFGGGVLVQHTYAQTVEALVGAAARVVAVTGLGQGPDCGAGRSSDVGQGFHGTYMSQVSIPERTGGTAIDIGLLRSRTQSLSSMLRTTGEAACF